MVQPTSLFARVISRPLHPRLAVGVGLLLLLAPLAAAWLDGSLSELLATGRWRALLAPAAVILYIVIVAPRMDGMDTQVLHTLRSVTLVDDRTFDAIVAESSSLRPRNELLAMVVGAGLGLALVLVQPDGVVSLVMAAWGITTILMYGLLGWTVYASIASTRLTSAILRQPLRINPLDTSPYETIGRQSLLLALIFVGGMTLSLLLSVQEVDVFRMPAFWLSFAPIALVPVVIFFLTMRPTHRVLFAAKKQALSAVRTRIEQASQDLMERLARQEEAGQLAHVTNALLAYEHRLVDARTWPYNTAMLRTLFLSVLVPAITVLGKTLLERLS
jgi:hypothetical protein